jgi:hypothetical protein
MSSASLQTFIDTLNCVLENRVQYSTVHIPNVFCDGHLHIINCVGNVRIHSVFHHNPGKKSGGERSGDLGVQMVVEMILSANTSSKSATDICAVWAVAPSCWKEALWISSSFNCQWRDTQYCHSTVGSWESQRKKWVLLCAYATFQPKFQSSHHAAVPRNYQVHRDYLITL